MITHASRGYRAALYALPISLLSSLVMPAAIAGSTVKVTTATGLQKAGRVIDVANTILSGKGSPLSTVGEDGDFYIDLSMLNFYGPKSKGKWPLPISLKGSVGLQGPAGVDGKNGVNGSQGPTGPKGDTGIAGPVGAQGATGPKGDTGATGSKGETGAPGVAGLKGDPGVAGPAGKDGAAGVNGVNGINGTNGKDGTNGVDGAAGKDGVAGKDGAAGKDGTNGSKGDTGLTGPQGPAGLISVVSRKIVATGKSGSWVVDFKSLAAGKYIIDISIHASGGASAFDSYAFTADLKIDGVSVGVPVIGTNLTDTGIHYSVSFKYVLEAADTTSISVTTSSGITSVDYNASMIATQVNSVTA